MICPSKASLPIVTSKIILEPGSGELSEQAKCALLASDVVHVEIESLNARPDDFPPATLEFLLRNADRVYGMVDCGPAEPDYWPKLIESMDFPSLEGGRWVVRLLASEAAPWEARVALRGYLGPFALSSPVHIGDKPS